MSIGKQNIPYIPADITSHTLRKTFVTRCAKAGMSVDVVTHIAGHIDPKLTYAIYTEVQSEWAKRKSIRLPVLTPTTYGVFLLFTAFFIFDVFT